MSDQAEFHKAMAADHADATTRLVYADWLDEHGQPEQAKKLRWWAHMIHHLEAKPYEGGTFRYDSRQPDRFLQPWQRQLVMQHVWRKYASEAPPPSTLPPMLNDTARAHHTKVTWPGSELHALGLAKHEPEPSHGHTTPGDFVVGKYTPSDATSHYMMLASKLNRAGVVRLAAIEAPNRTGGSVLVRVPTPVPTAPQAPQATGPATPLPNDGPAPKQPKNSGPAFILPQ